jgi:hypothetical protein
MSDPRTAAAARIATLLDRAARSPLSAPECAELVEALRLAPGMLRRAAHALSAQADAAAVDALLTLPPGVPGVVEGLYRAMRGGVARRRRDGTDCPLFLALDFRRSRARAFDAALDRARAVFGDALEALDVDGRAHYRLLLARGPGTLAGRAAAAAHDVQWLHTRLGKLRGARLWLNGWCFPQDGPISPAIQVHLVRGWLSWAATQTETRR